MTAQASETILIALIGNPNAGKTSLFNALTGSNQKVGNYPGVTVERTIGRTRFGDSICQVADIPGLYSLTAVSEDEHIAAKAILGEFEGDKKPDLFICVLDAANLERNLFFFSQVQELGVPIVAAVTMSDMLEKSGKDVKIDELSEELGCPVVKIAAHKNKGVEWLKKVAEKQLGNTILPEPHHFATIAERYKWAEHVRNRVIHDHSAKMLRMKSDRFDRLLTHRVFGMAFFIGVMYVMFQCIYTLSGPLMDGIQFVFDWIGSIVGRPLGGVPWLQSLVVQGIIGGIGSVAVFLPQILILFGFIAILEGTGYLARASFLMDRALGWCGLNGKAFIPLISSFACAIPGIMAARIMPDPKSRLATILVAPFMSCSARLPVYVLLIGAVIEPRYGPTVAGLTLFGMHLVGLVIAIPTVMILNRKVLRGNRLPFVMELPPYQWPKWKDVVLAMVGRAKVFVQTAGTIIVLMSIIVWAALYFPRSDAANKAYAVEYSSKPSQYKESVALENYVSGRQTEDSILGRVGKGIEPVFRPAGFDWRISTAILAAFPAREVMISSLGIIFDLGSDTDESSGDLRKSLSSAKWPDGRPLMTTWTSFALMVFFALCCQCGSTLAAIRRETNSWKWPAAVFFYMTGIAWLAAVGIHQLGRLFEH